MKRYIDKQLLNLYFDDEEFVDQAIEQYNLILISDTELLSDYLAEGVNASNANDIQFLVHKVKGASMVVGAFSIVAFAEAVENSVKDQLWMVADYNFGLLMEDISNYLKHIHN